MFAGDLFIYLLFFVLVLSLVLFLLFVIFYIFYAVVMVKKKRVGRGGRKMEMIERGRMEGKGRLRDERRKKMGKNGVVKGGEGRG